MDFESELQHIDVALRFDIDHIRKIVKEIQSGVKTVESELIEISRIPTHENDRQEKIDIWYNFCKYFCNVFHEIFYFIEVLIHDAFDHIWPLGSMSSWNHLVRMLTLNTK